MKECHAWQYNDGEGRLGWVSDQHHAIREGATKAHRACEVGRRGLGRVFPAEHWLRSAFGISRRSGDRAGRSPCPAAPADIRTRGRAVSGMAIADLVRQLGDSGAAIADFMRHLGDSGVPIADSMRHLGDSGTPIADSIRYLGDCGTPIADSMRYLGDSGSSPGDSVRASGDDSAWKEVVARHGAASTPRLEISRLANQGAGLADSISCPGAVAPPPSRPIPFRGNGTSSSRCSLIR